MGDEDQPQFHVQYLDKEKEEATFLKRPGEAKITYPNGDTYVGRVSKTSKHGYGVYTWRSWNKNAGEEEEEEEEDDEDGGSKKVVPKYEGRYERNVRSGHGMMVFPNGNVYRGKWSAGFPDGVGSMVYANGDIYSGQWLQGERNGKGTYEFAGDESRIVGTWEDGTVVSGEWIFKDGTKFTGDFSSSQPNGPGKFTIQNGIAVTGSYAREESGQGTVAVFSLDPAPLDEV